MLTHWEGSRASALRPHRIQLRLKNMNQDGRHPSRPIGNLMSGIVNTLANRTTATNGSGTRPNASETDVYAIGLPTRIGTQHGEHGSETQSASLQTIVSRPELYARFLRNPVQLLPPLMRSAIAETWVDGDTGFGWDGLVSSYSLTRPISEIERSAALAVVGNTLDPAGEDFALTELARLRTMTISRDVGQDLALVLSAYADELQRYPADAVREVLRGWRGKFWPAWAELAERLDRLVAPRHALRVALQRGYRKPEYSPDWTPPPTPEQKLQVDALLAEYGIMVDERGRVRPLEREPVALADMKRAERELPEIRDMWIRRLLVDEPAIAGAAECSSA